MAKKRKSAAPAGFRGPARGTERKFVSTKEAVKVMQGLLDELDKVMSGETGWKWDDHLEAEHAAFLLDMTIAKLRKCDPGQSFRRTGS